MKSNNVHNSYTRAIELDLPVSRSLIASLSMCFQQRGKINIVQSFSNFLSNGWFSHYKDVSWKDRTYIVTFEGDQRERIHK